MITKVAENVYRVGAVDYNVRNFHGYTYTTGRGTSYNAYLLIDEKIALVDTVMKGFDEVIFRHIKQLIDPSKIDYLIANHAEIDHTGAIPNVLSVAKGARIFCSTHGRVSLGKLYGENFDYQQCIEFGRNFASKIKLP